MNVENFIGGEFCRAASQKTLTNVNPATGEAVGTVPESHADDIKRAVAAASDAFANWSTTPVQRRSEFLLKIAQAIESRIDDFALAETTDTGKPLRIAKTIDIPRAILNFRFFATAILHFHSEAYETDAVAHNFTLRQPRGVAGLISPWNLPLYLLSWKIAPALAAGNTAVAKPSELTPVTAYLLAQVCREVGLPPGVLNIVHGSGASCGASLVAHPDVNTISFTGGTATGTLIAQSTASSFKKLTLEMGGKNPTIVFDDVNVDEVAAEAVRAAFSNQGQICLCGSRIFVHQRIISPFVEMFLEQVSRLRVGDPLDDSTDQGALISKAHLEKVRGYVQIARSDGGRILCGGEESAKINDRCARGAFFEPTVITGLSSACRVNQEEIFGPVVTIIPFETEDEVLAYANSTDYGLAASLWTRDLSRAHRLARDIKSGTVWVNCWMLRDLRVPFGGMKRSGVGKEGGEEALRFFTDAKTVCIKF